MRVLFLAAALTSLGAVDIKAAVNPGQNSQEHAALCALVKLARAGITVPEPSTTALSEYNKIVKLNMSVAPNSWRSMFFKDATTTKPNENPAAAGISHNLWEKQWPGWLEAERQLSQNKDDPDVEAAALSDLTEPKRRAAAAIIAPIAAEAAIYVKNIRPDVTDASSLAGDKPSERLAQAVFGESKLTADQPDVAKVLTATPGNNRINVCSTDHANKLKALLGAAICLCHKDNTGAIEGACGATIACETAWTDGSVLPTQSDVTKLMKSCGSIANHTISGGDLETKLTTLTELIKVKNTDGYLGSFIDGCSGNSANGMCVKFTNYATNPADALAKVPWLENIRLLAADIKTRLEHNGDDQAAAKQLQALQSRLGTASRQMEAYATAEQSDTAPPHIGTNPVAENKQQKCDKHHNDADNCTTAGCDYDANAEDGKKCKPKPEKQSTTGTGEKPKEGEAATGCARHQNQPDCKNDKTGEKQNCARRKGKDGEGEKYTEKCRSCGSL
uniref:Variant surface glycoprotein 1125.1030 n=1 Tax=Trypanosoma brucei TaxID=5691 RepID=A0A1J0R4E5_9TRYP|nr:variant surface glycoprotein 1125.1030 [Trypanosoma brucei]